MIQHQFRRILVLGSAVALSVSLTLGASASGAPPEGDVAVPPPSTLADVVGEFLPPSGEDPEIVARERAEARADLSNSGAPGHPVISLSSEPPKPVQSLDADIQQRAEIGLKSDRAHVAAVRSDPSKRARGDVEVYGMALTPDEMLELDERFETQDYMFRAYEYILDHLAAETYAGIWSHGDGHFYIGVTEDAEAHQEALRDVVVNPERFSVVIRDHSKFELEQLHSRVMNDHVEELTAAGALDPDASRTPATPAFRIVLVDAHDEMSRVRIGVSGDREIAERVLSARYGAEKIHVYAEAEGQKANIRDTTFWQPTRGGLVVQNETEGGHCSSGFVARKSDGSRWLLTSGHCDKNASSNPMFSQGNQNINPLQHVNNTTCNKGSNRRDVGGINLVSPLWSHYVYASGTDRAHHIHSHHAHSAVQSGNVQISRGLNNSAHIWSVVATNVSYTWYNDPTCYNATTYSAGLKQMNHSASGGDSGSPIFQSSTAEGMYEGGPGLYYTVARQLENVWVGLDTSSS